jgi:methylated-DNA-[protein]-cysteine S-methyltransferase
MKKKSPAEKVSFCVFDTAWGSAAIAWTEKGVCGLVLPGAGKDKVRAAVLADYPGARPTEPGPVADTIRQVKDYFAGKTARFSAPLDLSWATPFQARVYKALMQIPFGRTMSYAQIAARIGKPGASRAVGGANARNRVPLIIPCHRVIAATGALGGFSGPGGVKTKKRLLEMERAFPGPPRK